MLSDGPVSSTVGMDVEVVSSCCRSWASTGAEVEASSRASFIMLIKDKGDERAMDDGMHKVLCDKIKARKIKFNFRKCTLD